MQIIAEGEDSNALSSDHDPFYRIVFIEPNDDVDPNNWNREIILLTARDVEEVMAFAARRAGERLWALALQTPVQSPNRAPDSYVLSWLSGFDPSSVLDRSDDRFKRMERRAHLSF